METKQDNIIEETLPERKKEQDDATEVQEPTSEMSEQVTASEAMLLLCSSDTKKQSQIVQSEVSVMEQKSVMQKESDGEAEQNIIRNITGRLKRMSVEVPGGPKTKVKKTDADDHESLLLGETNELLDELDTDDDDKLLDDGHAESGKIDDKSSSPSSINYEQVEGEGSYSSEEECGADQFPPEVDNIFEPELSKGAPNQAEAHNSSEYVGHSCFAVPGVFHCHDEEQPAPMQTLIQPPGTNSFMQEVMKSRLPSTSSVASSVPSESPLHKTADVRHKPNIQLPSESASRIEQVMESRLMKPIQAGPQKVIGEVSTIPRQQQQQKEKTADVDKTTGDVSQSNLPKEQGGKLQNTAGVLSVKDPNVKTVPAIGSKKTDQQSTSDDETNTDEEHEPRPEEEGKERYWEWPFLQWWAFLQNLKNLS